ncbi:MAG: DNA helicase RecG, partial [Nitrospirae bacterium]
MKRDPLNQPVQYIKGVGPKRASLLARLGIFTPRDVLYYLPFRYEDRKLQCRIAQLRYEQFATVTGNIINAELRDTPRGKMKIFEVVLSDGS